jgi:hypothetical protein
MMEAFVWLIRVAVKMSGEHGTPGLQLGCLDNMSHCLHVPSSNISSQCRVQEASAKLIFLCQKLAVMGGDVDIQSRLFLATHPSIRCAPLSQKTSY